MVKAKRIVVLLFCLGSYCYAHSNREAILGMFFYLIITLIISQLIKIPFLMRFDSVGDFKIRIKFLSIIAVLELILSIVSFLLTMWIIPDFINLAGVVLFFGLLYLLSAIAHYFTMKLIYMMPNRNDKNNVVFFVGLPVVCPLMIILVSIISIIAS